VTSFVLTFRIPEPGVPVASLSFSLPPGASRPILEEGTLSGVSLGAGAAEVEFEVDQFGRVGCIKAALPALGERIARWRFTPSVLGRTPIRATAKLTLFGT
jgi:hypothetical protein